MGNNDSERSPFRSGFGNNDTSSIAKFLQLQYWNCFWPKPVMSTTRIAPALGEMAPPATAQS